MSNDFNKFNMLSIRNKRKRIVWAEYWAFFLATIHHLPS